MHTRKKFIKNIALTSAALLSSRFVMYANEFGYTANNSDDNVLLLEKSDADYEKYRKGFNLRIEKHPKIIAVCKSNNGVIRALQIAREKKLNVTVKSGGHCMEGFSNNDDGMVINLSLMNSLEFVDKATIKVQPAITLRKIYETLIPKGFYLPGGSCQSVAIGGLTLGGGYGLLSKTFGLTCDSLIEATMITANGNIINTKNDKDLLWLLKGGGNANFGVVTELKFKLSKAPKTMQNFKFRNHSITIEDALSLCKNWFEKVKTLPNSCFSAFIFNGNSVYIMLTNADKNTKTVTEFIEFFKAIKDIKATKTPPVPLSRALSYYYAEDNAIHFKNASAGLYKSYDDVEKTLPIVFEKIKKKPGILFQVNTLGGNIQNKAFEAASCFPYRDYLYFSELQAYWDEPKQAKQFLESFEVIQKDFADAGINNHYRNYPDINFKNWQQSYYGKNLDKLKAAKKKYDANNLFAGIQIL